MDAVEPTDGELVALDGAVGDVVNIPNRSWVRHADFVRQGPDLMLVGADGKKILVENYFLRETPPDLVDQSGAVFWAELVIKLAGPVAPGQVAEVTAGTAEPIGRIETIEGAVKITRADGTEATTADAATTCGGT